MSFPEELLVITRVDHYFHEGRYYAYTPYAREIDVWADLFEKVTVAGTLRHSAPPTDCSVFARTNIKVVPVSDAGGRGVRAKLTQAFALPRIILQLVRYMRNADAIHTRCPCDLGLLTVILAPLFSRKLIAKYATQWMPYSHEPCTWRFQRFLLRSKWWHAPVTVYGQWPNQPPHVIPFFTSMLTEQQISRARIAAAQMRDSQRYRVLFVGRLSKSKNVDVLIQAMSLLNVRGKSVECLIVGEGPEKNNLQRLASSLNGEKLVQFVGGLGFDEVLRKYEDSDVLVLASDIEGWPKAVAEGMAFGCVCVGTERGMMPQMLSSGRGFLVPPRDPVALARVLQQIADNPEVSRLVAQRAAEWAQRYSLEGLRESLRQVMTDHWQAHEVQQPRPAEVRF